MGKSSRDQIRHDQRALRAHFAARADELSRSASAAVAAAQRSSGDGEDTTARRRDLEAEIERIEWLDDLAVRVRAAVEPSAGMTSIETPAVPLVDRVRHLVARAGAAYDGHAAGEAVVRGLAARLDEPLRVAVAGRVKSGKSTLLNALVGQPLAATDAGECTRLVTWYRHGTTYRAFVQARGGSAGARPPRPQRRRRSASTSTAVRSTPWSAWSSSGRRRCWRR